MSHLQIYNSQMSQHNSNIPQSQNCESKANIVHMIASHVIENLIVIKDLQIWINYV
jgi:hypothetical protein